MRRRRFLELSALSATGVGSTTLAGCIGASGPGAGGSDTTTNPDDQTTTPTTTMSPDTPCPQVRDVSMHVCPGDDGGPISVDRSASEMPADGGTIAITVTNTTDSTVGLNPYAWGVHRRPDTGDWERVDDDRAYIEPWQELAPGDSLTWVVASDEDHQGGDNEITCALDLGPGTYGWTVELKREGADERVAAAAGFVVS